ncbi:hypothetical protein ACFFRR_010456 [Megaselia abdita]
MKGALLLLCIAYLSLASCDQCQPTCNNGNSCQPVKIQYSANGMNLNVEIGCDNTSCESDPEFESCQSCNNVPYGRVGYEEDCSKFCECVQGTHSRVGSCPEGLYFNANLSVCDFVENVNCSTITTDDPDNRESCENIIFGFVPYEKDCSKFCECLNGEINKVKQCNRGLLFNDYISNCDYPSNTTCRYGETTTPEQITTPKPSTTVKPSTTTTKPPKTTTSAPVTYTTLPIVTPEQGECIKCNTVDYGVVADEFSCRKFCICLKNEGVEVRNCSQGHYFDPDTEVCEEDVNSVCSGGTTSPLPITFDPHCDCGTSTGLIPYNGSCTKYCDCDDQEVVECPGNLYFDPKTTFCDDPSAVDCPFDIKTTASYTLPTPKYETTK